MEIHRLAAALGVQHSDIAFENTLKELWDEAP
jgi:hypothetical protein